MGVVSWKTWVVFVHPFISLWKFRSKEKDSMMIGPAYNAGREVGSHLAGNLFFRRNPLFS